VIIVVVALALLQTGALAGTPPPPDPIRGDAYDGRPDPPSLRDNLLIVPRLLLTPLRLLLNAVFFPTAAGVRYTQRHALLEKVTAALTTEDGTIGVRPQFDFVSGYRATFGLGFFDHKIVGEGTSLNAALSVDFRNIVIASAHFRPTHIARAVEYVASADYLRRDDYFFAGIGMSTAQSHSGARYAIEAVDQGNELRFVLAPHLFARAVGSFGLRRFGNGVAVSNVLASTTDQPIAEVFCARFFDGRCAPNGPVDPAQVPGFDVGTQFLRGGLGLRVDTRDSFFRPSAGAAASIDADYTHGLGSSDPSSYFRITGVVEGVLDVWKRSHVLVLRGSTQALVPVGSSFVPFSELPVLSTPDRLRGARWGKYRDYTDVLVTAEYRFPVWMWMDATLFVDWGGSFGKGYSGFDVSRMIPAIGAGVRVRTSSHFYLALQGAYGFGEGWWMSVSASMDVL